MLRQVTSANWRLDLEKEDLEKLEYIPGLRIFPEALTASGMIDAVAVACKRLELPLPQEKKDESKRELLRGEAIIREYQADGISRLTKLGRHSGGALLADDVGLGKTLQAINFSKRLAPRGKTLIVCPAYVRESWRAELRKWDHDGQVAVLGPKTNKKAEKEWEESPKAKWVITSYELVEKAVSTAFFGTVPDVLIMDEAHVLCGRNTKRSKDLESVAVCVNYKLALTATPMWSRPRDFYRLLRVLFGNRFGTPSEFDFAYCAGTVNEYGGMENKGASRLDELKLRLSYYMLRREKKDVLTELPPITRQVLWLDPTSEAEEAFHSAITKTDSGAVSRGLQATLRGKLEYAVDLAASARKFLLFTYLKEHARHMASELKDGRGVPCVCITGDIPTVTRHALVQEAEQNGWGVVATIDSLGAGVNLQNVASYGIMHAIDWVPLKMIQAEGRLHRMGQKDNVQWVYLAMKDTMDAVVVKNVVEKLDQWRAVTGDQSKELRDSLGDHVDGAGVNEDELLAAIYQELKESK